MPSEAKLEPIETTSTTALVDALAFVIRKGLPIEEDRASEVLLNLRSVYARAVIPSEWLSRLMALNELVPRLIASLADEKYREAVQILFGLAPGTRRSTLMSRRQKAARILGYTEGHFREAIEREILGAVAMAILQDLLRYRARTKRSVESLDPTGDTPKLGPEHMTHQEELTSRIWQHVYGLRAELIAYLRREGEEGYAAQAEDHRQAALELEHRLRELLAEWSENYAGEFIAHGDAAFSADAVKRLAAWRL